MAIESIQNRINKITASMAGVSSFLEELVQDDDVAISNQAFAMSDLLDRLINDLDGIAIEVGKEA